jgi:hypothetical protein
MDISLSLRQEDAADLVLAGLQSELDSYLGRPCEAAVFTEDYILDSNHLGVPEASFFYDNRLDSKTTGFLSYTDPPATVYLRQSPVNSVTSVTLTPVTPGSTAVALTAGTEYVARRWGIDVYRGSADDKITVVYNAGLAGINIPVLKLMILRAATREMQNMHDDVVGIKDLEPRNVAPMETGFSERELLALKRYRRVRVA